MGDSEQVPIKYKNILIVGDWVVDDYWVIAKHRSSTSSRTGRMHHRAVHEKKSSIRAFCGAGVTASILHKAYPERDVEANKITGLGLWADGDTQSLLNMFNHKNMVGHNPYRIHHPEGGSTIATSKNVNLVNLCDYIKPGEDKENVGTSRVIRTYLQEGKKITQLQRIDWELPLKNTTSDIYNTARLQEDIEGMEIDAIVIKDLGRGVITDSLITLLSRICEKKDNTIPWFVSSKIWNPSWLEKCKRHLKMLLIPQVAARDAVNKDVVNVWITGKHASKKALAAIENLHKDNGFKETMFIVLPDKLNALAVDFRESTADHAVFMVFKDKYENLGLDTNMASVFLGVATDLYLQHSKDESREETFKKIVCGSLGYTHDWQVHEIKRITEHETWDASRAPKVHPDYNHPDVRNVETIAYNHASSEWTQAVTGLGIVKDHDGKEKFELWRGMVDVDGYVCIADSKQKNITRLVHAINEYSRNFTKSGMRVGGTRIPQASCLLFASAGAGKTSLVRQLAENNNLVFMSFNITEMNRTTDMVDCFDKIMTTSLLDPTRPLLIFIDEINSKLENQDVYKMFLSPLEDGKYNREGKSFRLPSCFWVFASTESGEKIRESMKGSDFISRLTAGMISLDIQNKSDRQIENIYLAVSIMLSIFPDVNKISREVLEFFSDKIGNVRIRELRHFIEKFIDVQYGTVSIRNIPTGASDNIAFDEAEKKRKLKDESENNRWIPIYYSAK